MDDALPWPFRSSRARKPQEETRSATVARVGGEGDNEPVLVAVIQGPVAIGMAKDALQAEGIPAYIKQSSHGSLYGLTVGQLANAEVWVPLPLAERAADTLIGIGLLDPPDYAGESDAE